MTKVDGNNIQVQFPSDKWVSAKKAFNAAKPNSPKGLTWGQFKDVGVRQGQRQTTLNCNSNWGSCDLNNNGFLTLQELREAAKKALAKAPNASKSPKAREAVATKIITTEKANRYLSRERLKDSLMRPLKAAYQRAVKRQGPLDGKVTVVISAEGSQNKPANFIVRIHSKNPSLARAAEIATNRYLRNTIGDKRTTGQHNVSIPFLFRSGQ